LQVLVRQLKLLSIFWCWLVVAVVVKKMLHRVVAVAVVQAVLEQRHRLRLQVL
jgi:hypothetical protein